MQTEFVAESGALLATRRGRDPAEPQLWVAHVSALEGEAIGGLQFETDRARFLGRGHDLRNAVSIVGCAAPVQHRRARCSIRCWRCAAACASPPAKPCASPFGPASARAAQQALALVDKHRDMAAFERAKTLAWTQAQVQLRYLGIDSDEAQPFQRIANRVLYSDSSLRRSRDILEKNQLGQSALWPHGISGDLPLVLVRIDDESDLEIVKQLLRAHEYWRLKRLAVDLVILERPSAVLCRRICSRLWMRRSGPRRPAATRTAPSAGRYSCCARTCCPSRYATYCKRPRAPCSWRGAAP